MDKEKALKRRRTPGNTEGREAIPAVASAGKSFRFNPFWRIAAQPERKGNGARIVGLMSAPSPHNAPYPAQSRSDRLRSASSSVSQRIRVSATVLSAVSQTQYRSRATLY